MRSCAGPTGQVGAPACQLLPSCAAVTAVALATHTSGTTAAWLVGDGAGAGWPIAVGGDAVGRLGGLGRADGLALGEALALGDGLALADGLGAALGAGGWLGLGLAATGLEATAAGCEERPLTGRAMTPLTRGALPGLRLRWRLCDCSYKRWRVGP